MSALSPGKIGRYEYLRDEKIMLSFGPNQIIQ